MAADISPPAELGWLTDVIGADATLALIEAFGGTRVRVAVDGSKTTAISEVIGLDAQAKLVARFGDVRIKVPLCRWWRARIYRWRDGMTIPQIARRLGMVESGVSLLLRSGAPAQISKGPAPRAGAPMVQMALPLPGER